MSVRMARARLLWPVLALVAALLAMPAGRVAAQEDPNAAARFLAGLPAGPGSPLSAARHQGWQRHAGELNAAWRDFEHRTLARIAVWSAAKLPARGGPMFYMFGGPDFAHADAFFPHASTYVLSGLEPVGAVPALSELPAPVLAASLENLLQSLGNFLKYGYFITREMGEQLKAGEIDGTLPLLYVFLARTGKTIRSVEFVTLNASGKAVPARGRPGGVRIAFSGSDGRARTLYYFSTDLSDGGVAKSGFLKFCAALGQGSALVKSASYLMHTGNFSTVRDFLLANSAVIVQDDSGIPLKHFDPGQWRLRAFGQYLGPIDIFKRHHQPDLERLFARAAEPVTFGIGYRWHPERTNILVAERAGPTRQ